MAKQRVIPGFDSSIAKIKHWMEQEKTLGMSRGDEMDNARILETSEFSTWQHTPLALRALGLVSVAHYQRGEGDATKRHRLTMLGGAFAAAVDKDKKDSQRKLFFRAVRKQPGFKVFKAVAACGTFASHDAFVDSIANKGFIDSKDKAVIAKMCAIFLDAWLDSPIRSEKKIAETIREKITGANGVWGLTVNHWKLGSHSTMDGPEILSAATALAEARYQTGTPSTSDARPAAICWASSVVAAKEALDEADRESSGTYPGRVVVSCKSPIDANFAWEALSSIAAASEAVDTAIKTASNGEEGRRATDHLLDMFFAAVLSVRGAPFPFGNADSRMRFAEGEAKVNGKDADGTVGMCDKISAWSPKPGLILVDAQPSLAAGGIVRDEMLWEVVGEGGMSLFGNEREELLLVRSNGGEPEIRGIFKKYSKRWPDSDESFSGTSHNGKRVRVTFSNEKRLHVAVKVPTQGLESNKGTSAGSNVDELMITTEGGSEGYGLAITSIPMRSFDGKGVGSWMGATASLSVMEKVADRHTRAGAENFSTGILLHGEGIRASDGEIVHLKKAIPDEGDRRIFIAAWWARETRIAMEHAIARGETKAMFHTPGSISGLESKHGEWTQRALDIPLAVQGVALMEARLVERLGTERWNELEKSLEARMVVPNSSLRDWEQAHSEYSDITDKSRGFQTWGMAKANLDIARNTIDNLKGELCCEAEKWGDGSFQAFEIAARMPSWQSLVLEAREMGREAGIRTKLAGNEEPSCSYADSSIARRKKPLIGS